MKELRISHLAALLPAIFLVVTFSISICPSAFAQKQISIPLGGNAWSNHPGDTSGGHITDNGISGWTDPNTSFTVWFRVSHPGKLGISLLASVPSGSTTISVSLGGSGAMTYTLTFKGAHPHECNTGSWVVPDTGYLVVVIRGLQRSGSIFANIPSLMLSGDAVADHVGYVPDNAGNFFYWGRRGPSVHFNYETPSSSAMEYFYSEVTVPEDQDVIGSYFMADGFSVGYFGMQVNSATQRRVLFSVWSPFATDDPAAIPDSLKVRLAKKGQDVHTGSFGNEGSGGQSYLVYPWTAGRTYRFLLRAQPTSPDFTRFTAWFYAPEESHWRLIASWDRPATHTWLQHLHSFLENFEPDFGDQGRRALFANQWTRDSAGRWTPLTRARFTGDNTARKGYRLDYAGGATSDGFWLRNGGFFSAPTPLDTWFTQPSARRSPPDVDLSALP
jgi:hypothetical protein